MAKNYNKRQAFAIQKSAGYLLARIEQKRSFLVTYGDVYKMPKKMVRKNLRIYNDLIKACNVILRTDFSLFI